MKLYNGLLFILLITLGSCDIDQFVGSGVVATENRNIDSVINTIETSSSISVDLFQSNTASLEVTTDDNLLANVLTETSGNTLTISLENGSYSNVSFNVRVGLPSISSIIKSGSGNMSFRDFIGLDELIVRMSGSGNVDMIGSVTRLYYTKEGSGNLNGFDMNCVNVEIDQEGSGNIEITATTSIDGRLEGSGSLFFRGSPNVNVELGGSGSIIDAN